jgi:hypothetical protein
LKRAFAPHLAGRMLPGLFSCNLKIGQRERFPGDPWPHFPASPSWHYMHSTCCDVGLCSWRPAHRERSQIEPDWISMPAPARADQTPSPQAAGIDRASVGSMPDWQPADAGPQGELFAEAST